MSNAGCGHVLHIAAHKDQKRVTLRDICNAAAEVYPGGVTILWQACRDVINKHKTVYGWKAA